jgi:ribosomal protein S18 acetylase RimI-like enzyme
MNGILKLRPMDPDDEPFLREMRAELDTERLGIQYWGPEQPKLAQQVIDLQFRGHAAHYKKVKDDWETKDNIIELDGKPVGRFIISGDGHEIRLCDIAVKREYRGLGIGKIILDMTKKECVQSKRPLRLHVDKMNSAYFFYINEGFRVIEDKVTHYYMEWDPNPEGKPLYSFGGNNN